MTRRRIYLRAALFAEGPSDYEFLVPLINRLLDSLGSRLYPGAVAVEETLGIDAPRPRLFGEDVRIEALRALAAFRQFEAELGEAVRALARALDEA
jgi:hypothetical protein